jgi:hypothetical protein
MTTSAYAIALISGNGRKIINNYGTIIRDLLDEVSLALSVGGLSWVERAKARRQEKSPGCFMRMEQEGWNAAALAPALANAFVNTQKTHLRPHHVHQRLMTRAARM